MLPAKTLQSMAGSHVSDILRIDSHKGAYQAHFGEQTTTQILQSPPENAHFIIDRRVAKIYAAQLDTVLASPSVLQIEATEPAKSLDRFTQYVEELVSHGIRRDHMLFAIGGGIIQDITCFLAATLLRGLEWRFCPTTLLAQADSCIGSKSSINVGGAKNILGTFTPPNEIYISAHFLETLDEADVRSGVGEMLKVHAIDGRKSFDRIAEDYEHLFSDGSVMENYIRRSLEIKRHYIEEDEFDQGPRNIFNYGHSFGHAIEAATNFGLPHGLAVTIGMDMANYTAGQLGVASNSIFTQMHPVLAKNFKGYENLDVPLEDFLSAIGRDKKNQGSGTVTLILPTDEGSVEKGVYANDANFHRICADYLNTARQNDV
jgi:3-dehydroquinate synthase